MSALSFDAQPAQDDRDDNLICLPEVPFSFMLIIIRVISKSAKMNKKVLRISKDFLEQLKELFLFAGQLNPVLLLLFYSYPAMGTKMEHHKAITSSEYSETILLCIDRLTSQLDL